MENNESTDKSIQSSSWSSNSIAPASADTGFYGTAGFGDRDDTRQEPTDAATETDSVDTDDVKPDSADSSWAAPENDFGFGDPDGYMPPPPMVDPNATRRLYRTDGPIGGVSAGLAEYFSIDPVLVRLVMVAATIVSFPMVPFAYVAAWLIIPRRNQAPVPPIMTSPAPASVAPQTDAVKTPVDSISGK